MKYIKIAQTQGDFILPSAIISSTVTVKRPTLKTFPINELGSLLDWSPLGFDLENSLFMMVMDIMNTFYGINSYQRNILK